MADTVGMTLVLRADARGVVAEMKNAQGAVIDTARIMRSQLQEASKGTTNSLEELKKGMSRSRESAMFFTQSLGEFGPQGRTAQIALAGIGGAIMGGGGVLLALSLAQAAVRFLRDAWEAEAKATAEAAKGLADIKTAWDNFWVSRAGGSSATQALIAQTRGIEQDKEVIRLTEERRIAREALNDAESIDSMTGAKPEQEIEVARQKLAAVEAKLKARREALFGEIEKGARPALAAEATDAAAQEKAKSEAAREADRVAKKEAAKAESAKQLEINKAADLAIKQRIDSELALELAAADEKGRIAGYIEESNKRIEEKRIDRLSAIMQWETDWRKFQEDAARAVQAEWQAAGSAITSTLGDLGSVMGGVAGSMMQYFGQLIQKAVQLAIAMSATAGPLGWLNAAAAAAALISAVVAVPEFRAMGGPVSAGSPYIVGERGPELFVPGASGGIVPNHGLGGGVTVNISTMDARSFRRFALDNSGAFLEAVARAARDGRRG